MDILVAEKRQGNKKPRGLRAEGFIPGCVYGGKLEQTEMFQAPEGAVMQLVKSKAEGSKVTLEIDGTKHIVLLKEIARDPASKKVQHLSFQALVADEMVNSIAHVVIHNRDMVTGLVQQHLFEIPYRALPADMIETVTVDLEGMGIGDSVTIADLDIAKNDAIELLIELDSPVVNIVDQRVNEATSDAEEGEDVATEDAAVEE